MIKSWKFRLLLLLIPVLLTGCNGAIKIGFMGGMTGRLADLGISGRNGTQLAIEQLNSKGGIRKQKIELISFDDKQDSQTAERGIRELIESGIVGVVGPMTSDMSLAVLPLLNDAGIPMVSPTASTGKLTGLDDQFLRVNPPDISEAVSLAQYAKEQLEATRALVIYDIDNRSFTEGLYEAFSQKFLSFPGTVVSSEIFDSNSNPDLFTVVERGLKNDPDVVFLIASSLDAALLCQNIRKSTYEIPILSTGWSMTDDFIQYGSSNAEGVIFSHYFLISSRNPLYMDFVKTYTQRFGEEPDFFAMLAYNSVIVLRTGLENQKRNESLKDAIVRIQRFHGLQGDILIDQFGDCELERQFLTIKNATIVPLVND